METDLLLLDAAKTMNRDALVETFDLYAPSLYNYAVRLCGDPLMADQIVGDVFTKLLEQLAVDRGPTTNLRSYLYEAVYHSIIDEARSSRRKAPLEALTTLRQGVYSDALRVENQILFENILDAMQRNLTHNQRHVIILRFLEGFSLRETAAILGKDVTHVKVTQNRAIAKLRKLFESMERRADASLPRVE